VNFDAALAVADAVLYGGYALYPHRPSSLENQIGFTFGGLYPRAYSLAQRGADASAFHAECLLFGEPGARLFLKLRFLHVSVEGAPLFPQARAREVDLELTLDDEPKLSEQRFSFAREVVGHQRFDELEGSLRASVVRLEQGAFRLGVSAENLSRCPSLEREHALSATLAAAHALFGVLGGSFVSLLEPPEALGQAARECRNEGVFPVLLGPRGARRHVLASPIILCDHPEIAPESPGDRFDAAEIDEILSLRILTLTENEKREAAAADARIARLLARTAELSPAELERLHGALRDAGRSPRRAFRPGDRVRLVPRRRADILDVTLSGKIAIVESIERDFEDRVQLAVTIEDDPGRDLGVAGFPGHRFFYEPADVELVEEASAR
jgi:hydrogenase maturation protease